MDFTDGQKQDEWLSPQQAATLSRGAASRGSFARWAQRGLIEAIQLPNRHWRISKAAVEAMLEPLPVTPAHGIPVNEEDEDVALFERTA